MARPPTWCTNDQHPVRKFSLGSCQTLCMVPCRGGAGAQLWQRSCTSWRCACQRHNEQQHSRRTVSMHESCTHAYADRFPSFLVVHTGSIGTPHYPLLACCRFILNGVFRFYGANIADKADELIATATTVSRPILQSFTLNLVRLNKTAAVPAVTPGLLHRHLQLVRLAHRACKTVASQVLSTSNADKVSASCRSGRL